MRNTFLASELEEIKLAVGESAAANIADGQTETFESFPGYDLLAFKWCDVKVPQQQPEHVIVYSDRERLVVICGGPHSMKKMSANEDAAATLTSFIKDLILGDMVVLEKFENRLFALERKLLSSADSVNDIDAHQNKTGKGMRKDVSLVLEGKKELLHLKTYYEELDAILDETLLNDNGYFADDELRRLNILHSRVNRLLSAVLDLREYLDHVWEAYQAQIDIEQNRLMKFFTVITSVFMPLTLITGWYGMNFVNMPELQWKYGYISVIIFAAVVCFAIALYFRKKRWM